MSCTLIINSLHFHPIFVSVWIVVSTFLELKSTLHMINMQTPEVLIGEWIWYIMIKLCTGNISITIQKGIIYNLIISYSDTSITTIKIQITDLGLGRRTNILLAEKSLLIGKIREGWKKTIMLILVIEGKMAKQHIV